MKPERRQQIPVLFCRGANLMRQYRGGGTGMRAWKTGSRLERREGCALGIPAGVHGRRRVSFAESFFL